MLWTYRARPSDVSDYSMGVVDGDTLDLSVDLGFETHATIRARVEGIDTAEVHGVTKDSEEFERGMEQARWVHDWLAEGVTEHDGDWPLIVTTFEDTTGKYGRWIATITRQSDGRNLGDCLTNEFPEVVK